MSRSLRGMRPAFALPMNIEAAINAGMSGIVYHGSTSHLRRKLRELEVKVKGV